MKAFTDLLYFEPKIRMLDWPLVIEALKAAYPNIRWASGRELGPYYVDIPNQNILICNTLTITSIKNAPLLTPGMWANKEDFARHALGVNSNYAKVKDGWEHLGFKQDISSIFDSLAESKLIRKIIKESIDEFDWVDTSTSNLSGQRLYNMIDELFKLQDAIYHIDITEDGSIQILNYSIENFTVNKLHEELSEIVNDDTIGPLVRSDYSHLAKSLAPIIGPMEYYH